MQSQLTQKQVDDTFRFLVDACKMEKTHSDFLKERITQLEAKIWQLERKLPKKHRTLISNLQNI